RKVGIVTVAPDKTSVSVTGIYPLKPGAPAVVLDITLLDCGDTISWNANVWTGTMGQVFTPNPNNLPITTPVVCGTIACGAANVSAPNSANPGNVTITRGFYDKDGISTIDPNDCATVPYTVTTITTGKHHVEWPLTGA